jgi:hypothetical protein
MMKRRVAKLRGYIVAPGRTGGGNYLCLFCSELLERQGRPVLDDTPLYRLPKGARCGGCGDPMRDMAEAFYRRRGT